jgi:hypothetical protein
VVDKYLTEYEDNKIDHDTVARRLEKVAEQIRQLRHQRDELAFMLDVDAETSDTSNLTEIRDRLVEIIDTGTGFGTATAVGIWSTRRSPARPAARTPTPMSTRWTCPATRSWSLARHGRSAGPGVATWTGSAPALPA